MNPFDIQTMKEGFITPNCLALVDDEIQWLRNFDQDDEFFHITCHVDPALRSKIERGIYIDLERLLPSNKIGRLEKTYEENSVFKLDMKEGQLFVAPANETNGKISSIKK